MSELDRTLAIGSDHAGVELKRALGQVFEQRGFTVEDHGPVSEDSVDYPDYAQRVARAVAAGEAKLGILICGTGIGMSIAANKVRGIRAALCHSGYEAELARAHNDANVLCLGARVTGAGLAEAIALRFVASPFEGGRHQRRVEKMMALETAPPNAN